MNFLKPFNGTFPITQTYAEHVARAKAGGYCWMPGPNCSKGYYYGGIDWGMPNETPILAAQVGTVGEVRMDTAGYGRHVRLLHEELGVAFMTIYGHLNRYIVKAGDKVQAGAIIGYSDNTGNSTGPHLHFECRKSGTPFDPAPYLVNTVAELGIPIQPPADYLPIRAGKVFVIASPFMNIRSAASQNSFDRGDLPYGLPIFITDKVVQNDTIVWREVEAKNNTPLWVAEKQGSNVYISIN